jgi:alpha-ribazole phosphatase
MKHIFIRHPKLEGMQGICYGALDVQVPEKIILHHAEALKKMLPSLPIISSPLQRCLSLANALASNAKQDVRLLEMNFGQWQGKAWDDIDRVQLDRWANNVTDFHPPNGENFMDVIHRVSEILHDLSEPHIVITHAGVIRAAHFLLGGLDIMEAASVDVPYTTPIHP